MRRPFEGNVVITQEYGERNSFYRKGYHTGVDYGNIAGNKVVAPTDGKVIEAGYEANTKNGRGHFAVIQGGDGVTHHLYHMRDKVLVSVGQLVTEGTHLGYVGNTGASQGAHLHWETRRNGVDFPPGTWLFASKPVYTPPVKTEYVRVFGDFRSVWNNPWANGNKNGTIAPNQWPGKYLDYKVLERKGDYVKISTSMYGTGWILVRGQGTENLTQFYWA